MKRMSLLAGFLFITVSLFGADKTYLTIDELALYNGQNGKPAYVAVDGTVYDVTGVDAWRSGEHKSGNVGTDIGDKIKNAPHGKNILSKRTVVGKIVPAMTLGKLAEYNGKKGNPAYVAVNGLVYDQTGIAAWKTGEHKGGKAGTDISKRIKKAPHALKVFTDREPIAKIVPEAATNK